jgi:hypothetical protein
VTPTRGDTSFQVNTGGAPPYCSAGTISGASPLAGAVAARFLPFCRSKRTPALIVQYPAVMISPA